MSSKNYRNPIYDVKFEWTYFDPSKEKNKEYFDSKQRNFLHKSMGEITSNKYQLDQNGKNNDEVKVNKVKANINMNLYKIKKDNQKEINNNNNHNKNNFRDNIYNDNINNQRNINYIAKIIFRQSGNNSLGPIVVNAYINEKIKEVLEKYRYQAQDFDYSKIFYLNGNAINNYEKTLKELNINEQGNIFVVKPNFNYI